MIIALFFIISILSTFLEAVDLSLEKALQEIELLKYQPWKLTPLCSYSNKNWILSYKNTAYVIRLPREDSYLFSNRNHEYENCHVTYHLGFNPLKLLYFNLDSGVLLTPFLPARHFEQAEESLAQQEDIFSLAQLLKRLHTCGEIFKNQVSPLFRTVKIYERLLEKEIDIPPELDYYFSQFLRLEEPKQLAPCHNDVTPHNILFLENTPYLIDWEMSGMGDPLWDLCLLIVFGKFSEKQETLFLKEYGLFSDQDLERLNTYKKLVHFTSCIWAFYKYSIHDFIFPEEELKRIYKTELSLLKIEDNR